VQSFIIVPPLPFQRSVKLAGSSMEREEEGAAVSGCRVAELFRFRLRHFLGTMGAAAHATAQAAAALEQGGDEKEGKQQLQ